MRYYIIILLGLTITFGCSDQESKKPSFKSWDELAYEHALDQIKLLEQLVPKDSVPRSIEEDGSVRIENISNWVSGFYAGTLWYLYEFGGNEEVEKIAKKRTEELTSLSTVTHTHDVGFMVNCSMGNGYRLSRNEVYKKVLIKSALNLADRFDEKVGAIKSWDFGAEYGWQYPVIIDNMMNLELLFEAFKITGDSLFHNVAVGHAETVLRSHFREDNSSVHLVDFDSLTGKMIKRQTFQGYADESAWARGQAWGLYGYTLCYRYTNNKKYLDQAQAIASFYMNHKNLPADGVPYWDFNAPNIPNEPRDASAAAVVSSALFELSEYVESDKVVYYDFAIKTLKSLASSAYTSELGKNSGFVLKRSTGSLPHNSEINVPLVYADYYYLEALVRYSESKKSEDNQISMSK